MNVSSNSPQPGGTITVSGDGMSANQTYPVMLGGSPVGSVTADAGGAFTASVTIPASAAGDQMLSLGGTSCGGTSNGDTGSTPSGVSGTGNGDTSPGQGVGTSANTDAGGLAFTGTQVGLLSTIAGALILGGAALLLISRRRRAAE